MSPHVAIQEKSDYVSIQEVTETRCGTFYLNVNNAVLVIKVIRITYSTTMSPLNIYSVQSIPF